MADTTVEPDWWSEFGPDSPLNWNFDSVPDTEIIACCLWEYARESQTIAMKADLHWCHVRHIVHRKEYLREPQLMQQHNMEAQRIEDRAKREGFDYDAFAEEFWKTDFPLMAIYDAVMRHVREGAYEWQRLPPEMRTYLAAQVGKSIVLRPVAAATVGELEELWKANSADLLEVRARDRPKNDDCEDAALWAETEPVEPFASDEGRVKDHLAVALTVDFSRFTDGEISAAFQTWLKENRPAQWKKPRRVFPGARQKGRKLTDYRVGLERLGLMRLLHFYSPAQLREELPAAWKRIHSKEPDFRREIREASKFFRGLFPFLPDEERPHSEERRGVWFPPVQKIMDEMDRERGSGRGRK